MDLTTPPADEAIDAEPAEPGLFGELAQLFDDSRNYVQAEIAFQRARLAYGAGRAPAIGVLLAATLLLVLYALLALVIGLLIALTPALTIWGAMAVVAGVLLALAALAYRAAMRRLHRARAVFSGDLGPDEVADA